MVVGGIDADLTPDPAGPRFHARTGDPTWGPATVHGRFSPDYASFGLQLVAESLPAAPGLYSRIPFVSEDVWSYFRPTGRVRVVLDYSHSKGPSVHSQVVTGLTFLGTKLDLPSLDLVAEGVNGRMTVRDKVVTLDEVRGRMVGGQVDVSGMMDFARQPHRFDLKVGLDGVVVAELPGSWQMEKVGIAGRLTGTTHLLLSLADRGLDLTGSDGSGTIEGATWKGIPLGRLALTIKGQGLRPMESPTGLFLPQWIGVDFEVRDVDLERTVSGMSRMIPASGRLTLKIGSRVPVGTLGDLAAYEAHGSAELTGASAGGMGLDRLGARLDLSDGVLDLSDVRGRIAGPTGPDKGSPSDGSSAPGTFRGRLRANLTAKRSASAEFDGDRLPLALLVGLASSGPAPVSGTITIKGLARFEGESPSDLRSWTGSARVEAPEVVYRSARFRDASATIHLAKGRVELPDLAAKLDDHAFRARLGADLEAPRAFEVVLAANGFPLEDLIALTFHTPGKVKIVGKAGARAEARGTLDPVRVESRGEAQLDGLQIGRVPIGDVPLRWETRGDVIAVSTSEVRRYGGRIGAEATVPTRADRPIEVTITLGSVDAARLSAEVPGSMKLSGRADGRAHFRIRPPSDRDGPPVEGDARLSATDLNIAGIPAESVRAVLSVHDGIPRFDVQADGLRGKLRLSGQGRLESDPAKDEIDADLVADGLRLGGLWDALGRVGLLTSLQGEGKVTARIHAAPAPVGLQGRGSVDLHDLYWGQKFYLGRLQSGFTLAPNGWRISPMGGEIWGGTVRGRLWSDRGERGRPNYGVDLRVDRIELARLMSFSPDLGHRFQGQGDLVVRGESDGASRGRAEFRVNRGRVSGLAVNEIVFEADWDIPQARDTEGSIVVRRATARIAGGKVLGDARIQLGNRRDFHAGLDVRGLDLRVISRAASRVDRSVPGRISGSMSLHGPDATDPSGYKGRLDLDLDNASILDIPMLGEVNLNLGSSQGVFDDGDLHATIAHREIRIEQFTLVGPLAQLHASGTIGFDSRVNLEVLINTNTTTPASGRTMLSPSADSPEAIRRREQRVDRAADFLSSRLAKFRISGTVRHPLVNIDRTITVEEVAAAFFVKAMKLPLTAF